MVTTSLGVILFTTVFFGAVMPFFTRGLKPERPSSSISNQFLYSEFFVLLLFVYFLSLYADALVLVVVHYTIHEG